MTLDTTRAFLEGYTYIAWPNLSADRISSSELETTQKALIADVSGSIQTAPLALGATARVLGAYCGVSDILVAVRRFKSKDMGFLRISWDGEVSWDAFVSSIEKRLYDPAIIMSVEQVRDTLELSHGQPPALFVWNEAPDSGPEDDDNPISFSFDHKSLKFSICAPKNLLLPSVSRQIIVQVEWAFNHAIRRPNNLVVDLSAAPYHLMSVFIRASDSEMETIYSHAPVVRLATDYLARRAEQSPGSTAIQWYPELSSDDYLPYEDITYAELDRRSNQMARWLVHRGLMKEDRVAVCMNRDVLFHILTMGIMRSGGCYVPIDPELPEERKTYIANDSNAKFVLTSSDLSPPKLFGPATIYVDSAEFSSALTTQDISQVELAAPDDLAYMLYTSGTTGNPKGCLLTQRGLSQAILSLSHWASKVQMQDLTQGRYLSIASIAFDVHIAEIFVPLALGMPIVSAPRSQLLENLPLYVSSLGVTHLGLVPSLIEATMNAVQENGEKMALRYIASGGEKLSDSVLDKWADHPQTVLANFYGPSEATIGCCATVMNSHTMKANIGRPFANVSAYVVDANMDVVLRGGVGELVVEGPLVGRGYHDRPSLTQKAFRAWPAPHNWAYRTGDLVRMMPDSTIEILGRIDTQIKLRGVRIESEGVSAIVRKASLPGSKCTLDVVTVLAKHPSIDVQQLISFFAWDPSVSVLIRKSKRPKPVTPPPGLLKNIKDICEAELASYMRPSHFVPLSWLPLNSNGKADEKMLIGLFAALDVTFLTSLTDCDQGIQVKRPLTGVEDIVGEILLKCVPFKPCRLHPGTTVFECGLDSMGAVRFAAALKERFGQQLHASDIMKARTLESVASLLNPATSLSFTTEDHIHDFVSRSLPGVYKAYPRDSVEAVYPPFAVQEGVLARSAADDSLYVQHLLLRCYPGVSLPMLKAAWTSVMHDHPILRTVFHFGKVLSQVVLKAEICRLPWAEKEVIFPSKENFLQWFHAAEAASITINLNHLSHSQPPFAVTIYHLPLDSFMCLSIHHALYDGISLPLILDAVERAYLHLPPRPIAMTGEILNHILSLDLAKTRSFWTGHFSGYDWPAIDLERSTLPESDSCEVLFKTRLSSLKSLVISHQVTLQALFSAAFATILSSKIYGKPDVVFGVIRSGRLLPLDNVHNSLCPLIAILPLRIQVDVQDLLQDVQKRISETVEHEHASLGKVQGWIRPGKPLFNVLFSISMNDSPKSEIWNVVESDPPKADYVLSTEMVLSLDQDTIRLRAAWLTAAVDTKILTEVFEQFESIVLSLAAGGAVQSALDSTLTGTALRQIGLNSAPQVAEPGEFCTIDAGLLDVLRSLVADFLGVDSDLLSDTTSLISLGLDSIKSVGLARELQAQGHKVSPVELMNHSTLKRLAMLLVSDDRPDSNQYHGMNTLYDTTLRQLRSSVDVKPLKLSANDIIEIYPVTPLQAGMLSQTIGSNGKLYVHAFPLVLSPNVELEKIRSAWTAAVDQLSILRTSFHFDTEAAHWFQVVHSVNTLVWSETPYSSSRDYELQMGRLTERMALRDECDFHSPPFRLHLLRATSPNVGCHRLVLVLHHALYDGASIRTLLEYVEMVYRGIKPSAVVQFTELLPHFVFQERKGTLFWVQKLEDHVRTPLPRSKDVTGSVATTAFRDIYLDSANLSAVLDRAGASAQSLAQAAWAKLIASILNTQDIVFGHVVSGRSLPGAADVVGPVLNTIPCRVRLKEIRNVDLLRAIQHDNADAMPWQQASPRSIQRQLGLETLWDNLFLFQPAEGDANRNELWKFETYGGKAETNTQYSLSVEFHRTKDGFLVKCAAHPHFSHFPSLNVLLERLENIIVVILRRPDDLALQDITSLLTSRGNIETPVGSMTVLSAAPNDAEGSGVIKTLQSLISSISRIPIQAIDAQTVLASLGIDSITSIQVAAKSRQAGVQLSATDIASCRTFADLVRKAQPHTQKTSPPSENSFPISLSPRETKAIISRFDVGAPIERILPMSSGQRFLLAAWQKTGGRKYQHAFMFLLPQSVDRSRLKVAWILLLQRHPILRSTFANAPKSGDPRIVVFKNEVVPATWSEEFIEDETFYQSSTIKIKHIVGSPISSRLPQARAILRYSKNKASLLLHLHHFQYDAWSLSILAQELSSLYEIQYADPSNDLLVYLTYSNAQGGQLILQDKYWKSVFPAQWESTLFPSLSPVPAPLLERTVYVAEAAIEGVDSCQRHAAELQLSLYSALMACWARLQGSYTKSNDVCFGVWHSGRTGSLQDIEQFAVPCVNILPMYVADVQGDIRSVALRIQEALRQRTGIIEQTDFSRLHTLLGSRKPLTNVFLNVFTLGVPQQRGGLLEPVNVPFELPVVGDLESSSVIDRLPATDAVQDDLSVDVVIMPKRNAICVAVDASANVLNLEQAIAIVEGFSQLVKQTLNPTSRGV